jgi:hypothetical protein
VTAHGGYVQNVEHTLARTAAARKIQEFRKLQARKIIIILISRTRRKTILHARTKNKHILQTIKLNT